MGIENGLPSMIETELLDKDAFDLNRLQGWVHDELFQQLKPRGIKCFLKTNRPKTIDPRIVLLARRFGRSELLDHSGFEAWCNIKTLGLKLSG